MSVPRYLDRSLTIVERSEIYYNLTRATMGSSYTRLFVPTGVFVGLCAYGQGYPSPIDGVLFRFDGEMIEYHAIDVPAIAKGAMLGSLATFFVYSILLLVFR